MEIKRISTSEADLVIGLFNKYRIFYNQPSNLDLAKSFVNARLENNESVVFVALAKNKGETVPVGFTQLYPKFSSGRAIKIWILNDLYVEQEYRKQGVGKSLIMKALTYAKDDGASHVELSTAVDNYRAQRLYEYIGFQKQNPGTDFYGYKIEV